MYYKEIKRAKPVIEQDLQNLQETVSLILQRVKKGGDKYLREYYAKKYDYKPSSFLISPEEAAKAKDQLAPEVREVIDFAIDRVTAFAQAQRDCIEDFEKEMLIDDCLELYQHKSEWVALETFERILNKPFDYRGSLSYNVIQVDAMREAEIEQEG